MRFTFAALLMTFSIMAQAQECPRLSRGIRISATGDILVHGALYQSIIHDPQRFQDLWSKVIPVLRDADLTVGNLEGPVAPGTVASGKSVKDVGFVYDGTVYSGSNFVFNYHPYLIQDLIESGFDLVSTANNHAMDRGSLGVDRTIEQLNLAGLPFVGTRTADSSEARERIVTVKGYKIGAVSCTEMTNGNPDPRKQVLLCDSKQVTDSIARLKSQTDAVLVFPHWGEEYELKPNKYQKSKAREWVKAGATMILGNHPHVVQTTEWLERPDGGQALAIYSLGNFVAAQKAMERRVSAVAHIDLEMTSGGLQISQYSYTPIVRPNGSLSLALLRQTSDEGEYLQGQLGQARCR